MRCHAPEKQAALNQRGVAEMAAGKPPMLSHSDDMLCGVSDYLSGRASIEKSSVGRRNRHVPTVTEMGKNAIIASGSIGMAGRKRKTPLVLDCRHSKQVSKLQMRQLKARRSSSCRIHPGYLQLDTDSRGLPIYQERQTVAFSNL